MKNEETFEQIHGSTIAPKTGKKGVANMQNSATTVDAVYFDSNANV